MRGLLRPFNREEVSLYYDWMASEDTVGAYVECEDTALSELLERFDRNGWQDPAEPFFIYESLTGEILGYAHWWRCDKYEPHLEFGRVLLPAHRGRGLGTDFLRDILDKIFSTSQVNRVQAITAVKNAPVLHQWEKVGIQVEGTLRQFMTLRGALVDCKIGSILRPEWDVQKSKPGATT